MVRECAAGDPAQGSETGCVTGGHWTEVGDSGEERSRGAALFDHAERGLTAKASNAVVEVEDGGEDMFARAGVAAE